MALRLLSSPWRFLQHSTVHAVGSRFLPCLQVAGVARFVKPFIPKEVGDSGLRDLRPTLPRPYELMMQKVLPRIARNKRIYPMLLTRRKMKCSYDTRMSTPSGRIVLHRRMVNRKFPLWQFDE